MVLDDNMLSRYENYEFTKALGKNSWLSFLDDYFTVTQRSSREDEDGKPIEKAVNAALDAAMAGRAFAATAFSGNGTGPTAIAAFAAGRIDALTKDSPGLAKDSPGLTKDSPGLSDGCGCSVKNYPKRFAISVRAGENPNPNAAKRAEERAAASTTP